MEVALEDLITFLVEKNATKFCYVIYDMLVDPENCHIAGHLGRDTSFIFKYLNHYVFQGGECFRYLPNVPRVNGEVFVTLDPHNWLEVQKYFSDFSISDPSGEGVYNRILAQECTVHGFNRLTETPPVEVKRLTIDDWTANAPDYVKSFLEESYFIYGVEMDNKLVACAPAPFVYLGEVVPKFAVIRGVWTDPAYRGQNLSTTVMKKLCTELFNEHGLERICLFVEERNPAALRVYEKLGFQTKGNWFVSLCYFH
ncbi:MAG: GNAT family N-acetyltransferase [Candidatus Odinarchaeota archaeon]